jgi:hypothetical protein
MIMNGPNSQRRTDCRRIGREPCSSDHLVPGPDEPGRLVSRDGWLAERVVDAAVSNGFAAVDAAGVDGCVAAHMDRSSVGERWLSRR